METTDAWEHIFSHIFQRQRSTVIVIPGNLYLHTRKRVRQLAKFTRRQTELSWQENKKNAYKSV